MIVKYQLDSVCCALVDVVIQALLSHQLELVARYYDILAQV